MKVFLSVSLCVLLLSDFGASRSLGPLHRGIRSADVTPTPESSPEGVSTSSESVEEKTPNPSTGAPTETPSTTPAGRSSPEASSTPAASVEPSAAPEVTSSAPPSSTDVGTPETVSVAETTSKAAGDPVPAETRQQPGELSSETTSESTRDDSPPQETETIVPKAESITPATSTEIVASVTSVADVSSENAAVSQESRLDESSPDGGSTPPPVEAAKEVVSPSEEKLDMTETPKLQPMENAEIVKVLVPLAPVTILSSAAPGSPQAKSLRDEDPSFGASNPDFVVVPAQVIHIDGTTASSVSSTDAISTEVPELAEVAKGENGLLETASPPVEQAPESKSGPAEIGSEMPSTSPAPSTAISVTNEELSEVPSSTGAPQTTMEGVEDSARASSTAQPVEVVESAASQEPPRSDSRQETPEKKRPTSTTESAEAVTSQETSSTAAPESPTTAAPESPAPAAQESPAPTAPENPAQPAPEIAAQSAPEMTSQAAPESPAKQAPETTPRAAAESHAPAAREDPAPASSTVPPTEVPSSSEEPSKTSVPSAEKMN
ncbi:fibrous sheath CABYR-binding protein-like [Galendromus occidentalis]|uniref:Fibrous sheath CABYR-binding protein-like n=1 Tax=Galendromus occidentalis TaxID=34638 RepID=A0AAJ7L4D5_9ACAR|nr:fibrous sheath CABYR-binding protein-like [Galendromus occidentalis]